ncbi:hypothetical protein ICW40_04360 [Actinotalea ferrariae]|uniref:hypothetical protein n=1 Tax=Actinotalea ferrariae TaxID=1386098 RepID=UPI001C8BEF38|nr:hypothetical protein [Actinotalea ferrariae]MBX9244041.1 hypothetical protein [Actinotalea ferrariae]
MRTLAALITGLILLTGCTTAPEEVELGDGIAPTVDDDDQPTPLPDGSDDAQASPSASAVAGGGASPAPGACVDVPASEDGVYTVAEAGTVTVTASEGALTLGAVQPFAGWAYEVSTEEPTEVEVEFSKAVDQVDLEVEIEDGAPVVRVCADD